MGLSVREKIFADVKTTLAGVSGLTVARYWQHMNSLLDTPCAIILSGPSTAVMDPNRPHDLSERIDQIIILLFYRQQESDATATDTYLNQWLNSIEKALMSDYTRGGYAADCWLGDVAPIELSDGGQESGLEIILNVHYRYDRTDPETAR